MPKLTMGRVGSGRRSQRRDHPVLSTTRAAGRANEATRRVPRLSHRSRETGPIHQKGAGTWIFLRGRGRIAATNDTGACAKNRALAARKLALIEEKISELTMRDAL